MQTAAEIVLMLAFACIGWQDLKERRISWVLLPLCLAGILTTAWQQVAPMLLLRYAGMNMLFLLVQLTLVALYHYNRHRNLRIMDYALGWGDVLLVLVLCAAFSPLNFILFYTAACCLSLAAYLIYIKVSASRNREVPLAGGLALAMMLLTATKYLLKINLYNDHLLAGIIK